MALELNYGQPSPNGVEPEPTQEEKAQDEMDNKRRLAYLKALRESTKAFTKEFMKDAEDAWLYTIGEKRFPSPGNQAAKQQQKHLSRTVRNGMYSMMDHRVSFITEAEPSITMKVLQPISESERRELESLLGAELDRLHWQEDNLNAAWDAEVTKVGYVFFYVETDDVTGEKKICTRIPDPSRIYVNKSATSLRDARHVVMEEDISMAEIRRLWPDQADQVKAKEAKPLGMGADSEVYTAKTDDELVTLPGNEFIVTKDGKVVDQSATVTWAWERNPETRELWEESQAQSEESGYQCSECGTLFISDEPACPKCDSLNATEVSVPPGKGRRKFKQKAYPYGHCMIGIPDQNVLFFDGDNELPLARVFPFARLSCYKKSRNYYGQSTYDMLKSNQKARDQIAGLLQDHLRYNAHPTKEVPETAAEGWQLAGSAPGAMAIVPDEVAGQTRMMSNAQFDYQGWRLADEMLKADAEEITSVDEILRGGSPGPESGEAIKVRQLARSKRIGGYLKRYNEYATDYAAIVWELMSRLYTTPRTFTIRGPNNELSAITKTMSEVPFDVVVQVSADPDKAQTDRLMGQNLSQFILSGALFDPRIRPFVDDILNGMGIDRTRAEAIQQKLNELDQQAASQPQEPPKPPDPAAILVAISDLIRSGAAVARNQLEAALEAAGLPPPNLSEGVILHPPKGAAPSAGPPEPPPGIPPMPGAPPPQPMMEGVTG
jgi:hypothetical protein